ncbi:MAG: hypothetical protein ABIW17_05240 [Marmoricola sp.]
MAPSTGWRSRASPRALSDSQILAGKECQIDVPRGFVHRIANDQDDELVIVEIQVGAYTGEDDIVRLQDDYGRR